MILLVTQVLPPPLVPVVPVSLVGGTNDTAPESQRDQTLRQQGPLAFAMTAGHPAVPTKPAGKMKAGLLGWGVRSQGTSSAA